MSKEMLFYAVSINRDHVHRADRDSAADIGFLSGAVSETEEVAQVVAGVQGVAQEVLGLASMDQGLLGRFKRGCDR